jgi:hypothetical protein
MTSGLNVKGRFGKQDFIYVAAGDHYLCPAGEQLIYTNEEDGKTLRRYWTNACQVSLSQTPSGWRLIENRAMLLLDVRFVQTDLWNGDRPAAVASCA